MDGDDSNTKIQAISLIGYLGANVRVMLLVTPPSSIYIVGLIQTDYPPPGTAIVTLRQNSTVQAIADAGSGSFITWDTAEYLSLIHISEPTRQAEISYAVFCLKKKK